MQDSLENIVYSVGGGLVSPGVGSAELVLGLLVGLGFVWSAIRAILPHGHHHDDHSGNGRHA